MGRVGQVPCQGFLVREASINILVCFAVVPPPFSLSILFYLYVVSFLVLGHRFPYLRTYFAFIPEGYFHWIWNFRLMLFLSALKKCFAVFWPL